VLFECVCKLLVQVSEDSGGLFSVGAAVSTMCDKENIPDDKKTIFDWCREGNTDKVTLLLKDTDINIQDENVSTLLFYWSAHIPTCSK